MMTHKLRKFLLRARHFACAAAALTVILSAEACAAIDLASPQAAAGQWDMSLNDTNRKCRITLRPDALAAGFAIAMPAGCKRAMPILMDVGSWNLLDPQRIDLADASGKMVLAFNPATPEKLSATGPEGEVYELVSASNLQLAQAAKPAPVPGFQPVQPAAAPAPAPPPAVPAAAKPPSPAALAVTAATMAGRYSLLREGSKDTGCMLTLDDKVRGLKGNKAQLAPACRDQGMVIFDPAGWSLEKGRLVLTARKGHQTHLDLQPDGMWMKDPKEGKTLSLKKF